MTADAVTQVLDHVDATLDAALDRLLTLLRVPSISTDPAFQADCDRAADALVDDLASLGFDAAKHPTPGHPMVVAQDDEGEGLHVLFYGHYDVQPVDPLSLWHRDPFDPQVEDTPAGRVIRGRGAAGTSPGRPGAARRRRAHRAAGGRSTRSASRGPRSRG